MRRVLSFITILTLGLVLSGCTESSDNQLAVGLECNYAPFNWTTPDEGDQAVAINGVDAFCDGYDVAVATYLADELDMELVISKIEWDGLIPALLSDSIDVIIAGMSPTPERAETVSFTNEYYRSEQVLVVQANSLYADATSLNDFDSSSVVAQLGTLQDGLIDQIPNINHMTALTDYPSLVQSVVSGTSDALVAELPVAESIVSSNSDLVIVRLTDGFVVDDSDVSVSIAVRQDETDLQSSINALLETLDEETRNEWMSAALNRQP